MMADRQSFYLIFALCIVGVCALSSSSSDLSRRDVLIGGSLGIAGLALPQPLWAEETSPAGGGGNSLPIAVLGATGRTAALCVTACLERGIPVRALTRSGIWQPEGVDSSCYSNPLLTVAACDLKDSSAIQSGVRGCRGVIYAASASKNGGNAKEIDNVAVVEAAKACLQANVGRYVVLSSTATTRPKSMGYKFTNMLGGIMDEKRLGEQGVQELYAASRDGPSSYTIVRPGGLEEPKKNVVLGPKALEVSQGDVLAGIISRADLAQVSVELANSNASNLRDTAIELYYTDSAQPCERRFKSQLVDGVRLHGETYQDLFNGIKPDIDYFEQS